MDALSNRKRWQDFCFCAFQFLLFSPIAFDLFINLSSEQVSRTKERLQLHGTVTLVNLFAPLSFGTMPALKAR